MIGKTELTELIGLLEERIRVIGDTELRERDPETQFAQLKAVSESIVSFHEKHRTAIQPRLNHFLESCSFEKAREWAGAELQKP